MKVGLLGAGRIGALHASVLARDPAVDEILVGDSDMQRAEEVARKSEGKRGGSKPCSTPGPMPS